MWFLEWEEDQQKQEMKRKKWFVLAVFCFAVAVLAMLVTQHVLYDGIVKTNTGFLVVAVVTTGVSVIRERDSLKIRIKRERSRKAEYISILVATAAVFAVSAIAGQVLSIVQWVCLIPVVLWLADLMEKEKYDKDIVYAFSLGVISLVMLVTTVFAPKLMGYQNIYGAERIVAAQGYENAEYLGWMKGAWVYQDAVDQSFYEEEMQEKPYYMVFGRMEGEPYRFIIDPKGGEVIIAASEKEEPELGNWYK